MASDPADARLFRLAAAADAGMLPLERHEVVGATRGRGQLIDAELEAASNIIEAATITIYKRVFFLGPYARRVSFASMQNRALNLLWALQGTDRISPGDHVAVVGGGLSGITATACLLDLGYTVTMYEGGENIMNRQVSADHRYIHPTVNRWPEGSMSETTAVPYFDWVSSVCSTVVETLRNEWKLVKESANLSFHRHVKVLEFAEREDEVGLETEDNCGAGSERYTAVLVTSGFADEDYGDELAFPSYWRHDNLETLIASPAMRRAKYLISGCGDGGLIEALRIAHVDFEKGRLIVDTARRLTELDWPGLKLIGDAEAKLAADRGALEVAILAGSDDLKRVYEQAAKELPEEVAETLKGVDFH